jgi:hypothetical protein
MVLTVGNCGEYDLLGSNISSLERAQACCMLLFLSCLAYSSTLKMEAIAFFTTSGSLQAKYYYNPETVFFTSMLVKCDTEKLRELSYLDT